MKSFLPLFALAAIFGMTADLKAGLLDRMLGGGSCCNTGCCEATCAAAEPACGCAAEPACGCAAEPTCGCAPACDSCCDSCCGKKRCTPIRDLLGNLHCRLHSFRDRCSSCCNTCCEPACGCAAEPACGCAAAPTCGCAR